MLKNLILLLWFMFHPVHVTLTSVDYVPKDGCLKVFIKIYFDDFLLDIEQTETGFLNDNEKSKEMTENYLNQKLIIKSGNKMLTGKLDNFEIYDNEVKIHMEYKTSGKPKELLLKNMIMTGLYNDQSNLVIVKVDKFEEGFKFTSDITEQVFEIGN